MFSSVKNATWRSLPSWLLLACIFLPVLVSLPPSLHTSLPSLSLCISQQPLIYFMEITGIKINFLWCVYVYTLQLLQTQPINVIWPCQNVHTSTFYHQRHLCQYVINVTNQPCHQSISSSQATKLSLLVITGRLQTVTGPPPYVTSAQVCDSWMKTVTGTALPHKPTTRAFISDG